MNIVLGASGQVGAAIVKHLLKAGQPVTGVVRSEERAVDLKRQGVQVAIADAFDLDSLKSALQHGDTVFVLTPETGHSDDMIGETKKLLANYKAALAASSVRKIVGLSSMGAQYDAHSGNLKMSALLEHVFEGLSAQQIFVRPAYFYSNWLLLVDAAKANRILPTFYPVEVSMPMISPLDVAAFIADVMSKPLEGNPIYEVEGPRWYSSANVAQALSEALKFKIEARQTPRDQWPATLQKMGFTPDAIKNFIEMTELVASGTTRPEGQDKGKIPVKTPMTLQHYLAEQLDSP